MSTTSRFCAQHARRLPMWNQAIVGTAICCVLNFTPGMLAATRAQELQTRQVAGIPVQVAAGLEVNAVAGPDLVKWPIVADWDPQGRLVVAESGGVAKPIVEHNKQLLHRIVRLVDSNGDGTFDQRIVAADKLAFPEGVLCVGNSILVSAPPQIWKLTDRDGDGVCEDREIWFDPGTITGCANDLHGPYMGRDGWIYWCKGAFAEQTHQLTSGKTLVTKASHIFRRRLEGGPVEPVMTGGMDNPVEMAISHTGERFFTSTFLQHPAGGKRDGIAHALYGGVYGKDHDVNRGHIRTGDLLPILTHLGPAAPSGLICLESNRLLGQPQERDTLVAAQFNLHKVTAHTLVPKGAGFVTEDRELITSERIDFHPTDIIEAPDGSLLVIDTGGWYKLCCPSSGIDQSIALGGIYRLTSSTTRQVKADSTQTKWLELSTDAAIQRLRGNEPLRTRENALWNLCRNNDTAAQTAIIETLTNEQPELRQIAAHAISVQRMANAREALEQSIAKESNSQALRAQVEAIGRVGNAASIPTLIKAFEKADPADRMLEHSLLYALIELEKPESMTQYLAGSVAAQRAALITLDQLQRSDLLNPQQVLRNLSAIENEKKAETEAEKRKTTALVQTSRDILIHYPQWASVLGADLKQLAMQSLKNANTRGNVTAVLAAWQTDKATESLLTEFIDQAEKLSASEQAALFELLSGVGGKELPVQWQNGLASLIGKVNDDVLKAMLPWLASFKNNVAQAQPIHDAIIAATSKAKSPLATLSLLAAIPQGAVLSDKPELEALVIESYLGKHGSECSQVASSVLPRIKLTSTGVQQLLSNIENVAPLQLMPTILAISAQKNDTTDELLLKKLAVLPAARTLPFDQLTSLYRSRSEGLKQAAKQLVETLGKPPADIEAKLDTLLGQLKSGDAARGFQVFRGSKAACSACHRIGYVGGLIGPELSRIGATRTRRALLEAIVFPSARLEQSYTPTRVLTVDGQVINGLVARDSDGSLELITSATQRVTVPHADIEQRLPSPVSIMPAGLEQQLTLDELADLLTLLESAK